MGGQELMEEDGSGLPVDPEQLQTVIEDDEARVAFLQECIAQEDAKMERYRVRGVCVSVWRKLPSCTAFNPAREHS